MNKESNDYGWVKLHRKIALTSFYSNVDATYLAVHLLLHSNFKDSAFNIHHTSAICRRGQYLGGYKRLSKELGWGKTRVRRAIKRLADATFLTTYSTNQYAILTICNYNSYQTRVSPQTPLSAHTGPPGVPTGTPVTAQPGPHHKNVKNVKKEKPIVGVKDFDYLWSLYPRKIGKKVSVRHMTSSIKTAVDVEDCARAIQNYLNSRSYQNGFVQYGSTFFNNWTDWVTDPDPGEDPKLKELKELVDAEKDKTNKACGKAVD